MPNVSEKDLLQNWETLLAGLREATPRTARITSLQALLANALYEAHEIREGREIFIAAAADARENLDRVINRGRDAAATARNYLKFHFGPYNDELIRFGVNPVRRGKRKL